MKKVVEALSAGHEVDNPAAWKNGATAVQTVSAILGAGVAVATAMGYRVDLDANSIAIISGGVVAVGGLFAAFINIVTSQKVGLFRGRK